MRGGSTLRIAWRNLGRSRRRTALALAAIAIAQTAVLLMNGLLNGRGEWMIEAMTGPMMGHAQVHAPAWREEQAPDLVIDRLEERLAAIRGTEGVAQAFARLYAPALAAREVDGHAVIVIGIDPERESGAGGLLEGLPADIRPHDRSVLVGAVLAREAGIEVGDELAVLGQGADGSLANDLVTVAGILRTPVDLINRSGIVMPLAAAQDTFAMPDMAHEITIRGTGSGDDAPALVARLGALEDLDGLEVLPWRELAPELSGMIAMTGIVGLIALLIVFVAAAAGVANTMLMATFERRRELGMLLSLGTTPMRLVRMILAEAVMLGLLGVLAGSVAGGAIVLWQGHVGIPLLMGSASASEMAVFGLNFSGSFYPYLRAADYVPGFVGVTIVSVLAALWPAIFTARLEPMEAMRS
ncbi:MAG: ABC transporter permease [Myxococcota bacterium]|nr:ABC transporter permease [Myxococcota bacterium]